jgi:hypothetical protein
MKDRPTLPDGFTSPQRMSTKAFPVSCPGYPAKMTPPILGKWT